MSVFEQQGVKVEALVPGRHLELQAVRVDERGLWLDGELALAKADIASVSLGLGERTTVRMKTRTALGWSCTFTNPADANALLVALGRDPDRTTVEIALEPSLLRAGFDTLPWWKAFVVVAVAIVATVGLLPFLTRPHVNGPVLADFLKRTLDLGADGVRVRERKASAFLSYSEIASVTARDNDVVLTLRDGRTTALSVSVAARVADVIRRIERGIAAATIPADEEIAVRLHEVTGAKAEQVTALRELGAEDGASYREGALPRERLWGIVEDPRAMETARARAAIALSGQLGDADRHRLRVAADATVSPRLRVAMDAVEHEDDDQLAEHLDDLPERQALR